MPTKKQLGAAVGIAAGAAVVAARLRDRGDFERLVALPGVAEPIEIRRDAQGIPHIRAASTPDLMYGFGYATAQDRLWQLDILHRVTRGRLSEIVGAAGLEADQMMCSIGLWRSAKASAARLPDGETKTALDCFAAGVNAYIAGNGTYPGVEFLVGRYHPIPWEPAASIAMLKMMGWNLDNYLDKLLQRDRVSNAIGEELAAHYYGDVLRRSDPVVPSDSYRDLLERMGRVTQTLADVAGIEPTQPGSNNWAVAGIRTASGKPLLANDPHLGFTLPSVWYECHLTGPGINAAGATIPGIPGIAIGHNDHVAWGITASMLVQTELYIEQFDDPDSRLRYRTEDGYAEVTRWMDVIPVKGRTDAVAHETLITRHGPVITGTGEAKDEVRKLALRWVGHEEADEITGLLDLMRANTVAEFRSACAGISIPSLNMVFADTEGHIAYQYVGKVPIRPDGCGERPVPGWDGAHEWQGFVPFAELPHRIDPPEGFIATANTRIPADDYPYPLPGVYVSPFRQRRIVQLLENRTELTMEDMRRIQADTYVLHAEPLRPVLLDLLDRSGVAWSETEQAAIEVLRAWDGFAEVDSPGAAIWEVTYVHWLRRVLRARFSPEMTEDLMSKFMGEAHWALPDRLFLADDIGWFAHGEARETVLRSAFTDAVGWLREQIGPYPAEWEWGAVHRVTFQHPIAMGAPALGKLVNVGPIPIGGECNTVNCAYYNLAAPYDVISGASFRLLVDLADPSGDTGALASNTAGQSGNPRSPHYRDQAARWSQVRYHPFGTDAASVAARAPHITRLVPDGAR